MFFNTTAPQSDLTGNLSGQVQFAQSQIIPARVRDGDNQPRLVSQRKVLVMLRSLQGDLKTPMSLHAFDKNGNSIGSVAMTPPADLPTTVYSVPGVPEGGVDFTAMAGSTAVISSGSELSLLSDSTGSQVIAKLTGAAQLEIRTADGSWVRDIYLPQNASLEAKKVVVRSSAGYNSTIYYDGRAATIPRGGVFEFKYVNGHWFRKGELDNNAIAYTANAWSADLPASWIMPGLRLSFTQGSLRGDLNAIKVGAPTELLMHTIDIGMLTAPRNRFAFANDPSAHREYFQTIPASRLLVSQYAPLHLTEVMLPDGTLLKDFDPSEGGWHTGTMRQRIGKELISHGIDNANYALNSTAIYESSHPYLVAQLAAHNSIGKYSNGIQVHGGSGGGGIVTLDDSLGNEFSHEVGHNYGLGHYVDGFKGSVHRSADQINSTWGWDADRKLFMPNFFPTRSNESACLDSQCQLPFDGHKFGFDSMAGGEPFSSANRFTLYTPNSAAIIQRFLESKAVFDSASPSGFSKWNPVAEQMEPFQNRVEVIESVTAGLNELTEAGLTAKLAQAPLVKVQMADGQWTRDIRVPAASALNRGRSLSIMQNAGYNAYLYINGEQKILPRGYGKSFTSDGQNWVERDMIDTFMAKRPEQFGVPVTTLVGYYDPQAVLPTYIYPALYGAYGFTYAEDSGLLTPGDCQLQVETASGLLKFKLANQRLSSAVMNKFHVNVPTSTAPRRASVQCNAQLLAEKTLAPAPTGLSYSVNGRPLQ